MFDMFYMFYSFGIWWRTWRQVRRSSNYQCPTKLRMALSCLYQQNRLLGVAQRLLIAGGAKGKVPKDGWFQLFHLAQVLHVLRSSVNFKPFRPLSFITWLKLDQKGCYVLFPCTATGFFFFYLFKLAWYGEIYWRFFTANAIWVVVCNIDVVRDGKHGFRNV